MKFYVVQFVETPYPNIEKYVCVPSSWIRRFKVRRVKVAYPTEDPKKTKRRVENEERFKNKWKLYKAYVKYDTDDYDEAEIWIDVMNAVENDENVPPVLNNNNTTSDAVKNPKPENSDLPNENKPLEMDNEDDQSALLKCKETQIQPSNPSKEIPVIKEEPTANKQDTPTEQPVLPCSEKQPKIEATESENDLNLSSDSMEILSEEPINQEVSNQRSVTTDMVDDACSVKDSTDIRASLENQSKESLFTAETFNFINNSIKSLQQKRISVVSDEFLFRGQEEPSKSTEINKNGETSLHGDHDKTLAIKIIEENLIKYVENRAQQNQDIKVNQNQIHPESLPDKPNGESSDVNHDGHIKTPCIANNVISTVQNVLGQASSNEIQYSTPQDTFLQQDSTKKDIIGGPVKMISTIQEKANHNMRTKTASSEQNSSNPANNFCQPFEDSHENGRLSPLIDFSVEYWLTKVSTSGSTQQNLLCKDSTSRGTKIRDSQESTSQIITSNVPIENVPSVPNQPYLSGESTEKQDFNVTIERDSNIHKIVITRSNETECNNVSVPAQSFSNTSPSEHSLSTTNQASKVSKRQSQEFSAATKKRSPQNSPTSKSIVRTTTGGVPMDLLGYGTSDTNNQSQFYRLEQNGSLVPSLQPYNNYNLNIQNSNVQEKANRGTRRRRVTKTRVTRAHESPILVKNSNHLSERIEQRLAPIVKGYVMQDPHSGALYIHPIPVENFAESRHNITNNTQSVKQNIPTTRNQSSQFPEHSKNQHAPISQQCYRPNCPIHINYKNQRPYPQNIPKSTPPAVQTSSPPNHSSYSYSHGRQYLTVDQHHNRVPRIQQTLGEKTTNENSFIERTIMNAENRPYVVHNIPNKSYPTLRSSMDASKLVISSNQQSTNQRMHLDRNINQNLIDPSANSKDKTEEQSFGIENSSRRSPIDELTIYVDDLDEEMPIQLTHAKGRNNTDQNTYPTNDMCGSKSNKKSPNVDQSKPAEVENLQNEFNELYRKMDTAVSETYKMFNQMRDTYVDYVETMKKAMKRVNDFCELKINDISAPSKDIEENKGRHTNEELKRSYKHIGNNVDKKDIVNKNDDDDENHKDLKKKCVHKRSSNIWNPYHGTRMI